MFGWIREICMNKKHALNLATQLPSSVVLIVLSELLNNHNRLQVLNLMSTNQILWNTDENRF